MRTPLTPLDFARRARRLYPDREAVVDGELRLTYDQFLGRCDRGSAALQALGVAQGDRVAYIAPNTHAQLEGFYAVPQIGAVLVPINFRLAPAEFAYIIGHSGATVVCAHRDYLAAVDRLRDDIPGVRHFVALEGEAEGWLDYETLVAEASPSFKAPNIEEDDLISINYTSGTTSRPKGVMITHRNAWVNAIGTLAHHHMDTADRYLWTLPMFHCNGWTFVWSNTACGAVHVCLRQVEPQAIFQLLQVEGITMFCAAPTVLIGIANAPEEIRAKAPRGVRLFTAGAPPAAATIERVESELGWDLTQVYGLTETAPFITICEPRPEHDALSAADRATLKARQGVELMTSGDLLVVGEDGNEVPWDGNTLGEITVRGNVVMKGYYNDPKATAAAFTGGYFHSGDAAVVHPDGYVEIRDRIKDVIVSGGENISTVEVEGVLLRHPAVQEAAVVGMPHEKWGESPHAFIICKPGAEVDESEIRQFVRDNLAHYKTPQWFSFVDELPKTATGKIQKFELRKGQAGIQRQ
ncbi:MAG: long-chain-fatty-acid--CoA ligase [Salinisphaera sp.]|nr:long-chain-fatty-acid--CoA ligase [Salinisphaera sp.]